MVQSYKYYLEQPERIKEIDYEDLLLNLEEKPFHAEVKVLALMKQKFTFGQIDEELIHNLIATTSDKMILNEYLEVIEQFPSKSEYLKQQAVSFAKLEDDHPDESSDRDTTDTSAPDEDHSMTVVEEQPGIPDADFRETNQQIGKDPDSEIQTHQDLSADEETREEDESYDLQKKKKKETRFEKVARKFGNQTADSDDKIPDEAGDNGDMDPLSFRGWLHRLSENPRSAREVKRKNKKIRKDKLWKKTPSKTEKLAEESVQENEEVISETLANLYVQQGLIDKAVDMYDKLSLKFPEKSVYFAAKIEELNNLNS